MPRIFISILLLLIPTLCHGLRTFSFEFNGMEFYVNEFTNDKVCILERIISAPDDSNLVIPEIAICDNKEYLVTEIGLKYNPYLNSYISNISEIKSISIPKSIKKFSYYWSNYWRYDWPSLNKITVSPENKHFLVSDGILFTKDMKELILCPRNRQGIYVVPDKTKVLWPGAFTGCSLLDGIILNMNIRELDFRSFAGTNIESIFLSKNIKELSGFDSLFDMKNLKNISINPENSHYTIIDGVIYNKNVTKLLGCAKYIESVDIPETVTDIRAGVFISCTKLKRVVFPPKNNSHSLSFSNCTALESIILPETITKIGNNAFLNCENLSDIYIPETVKTIGSCAFENCYSLKSINIPNSVTGIGLCAFQNCKNLINITIPDSIQIIDSSAFENCKNLRHISLSKNITKIGQDAFRGCETLDSINIPNSVKNLGAYAFMNCKSLKYVKLSNSLDYDYTVFLGCDSIETIYLSTGTQSINIDCSNMKNLKEIFYPTTDPMSAPQDMFWFKTYDNAILYVPKMPTQEETDAVIDKFYETQPWCNFQDIRTY